LLSRSGAANRDSNGDGLPESVPYLPPGAGGRLSVREAKTPAGVRQVDLLPALRDELASYRLDADPQGFVFPTRTGDHQNAENLRKRMSLPAVKRANLRLAEREAAPLPERLTRTRFAGRSRRCSSRSARIRPTSWRSSGTPTRSSRCGCTPT
jgi:hypothetical protein